jgi:hypothetical protein
MECKFWSGYSWLLKVVIEFRIEQVGRRSYEWINLDVNGDYPPFTREYFVQECCREVSTWLNAGIKITSTTTSRILPTSSK